jgi:hypothetical protein
MDEKVLDLFEILGIPNIEEPPSSPYEYDCNTPFEKCTAIIDLPTTVSNNTCLPYQ